MAYALTCSNGHMDLKAATRKFRAAEAGIARAEARAARIIADARARRDQARTELAAAIVEAADQGTPQVKIIEVTGYSREHIRRIIRAAE